MSMSKIEKAILSATKEVKKKVKESSDKYLKRLVTAVFELTDDEWDELPEDAQEWFNEACPAANEKKQIPPFPDAVVVEGGEDSDTKINPRVSKKTPSDKGPASEELEEEMEVILYDKKDKKLAEGEVFDLDKKQVTILDDDGQEVSITHRRIARVEIIGEVAAVEEEELESGGDDDEEIDPCDIEKGQLVRIFVDDEEFEGTVDKISKLSITMFGERYKLKDIDEAFLLAPSNSVARAEDDDVDDDLDYSIDPADVVKGMSVEVELENGDIIKGEVERVVARDGDFKAFFVEGKRCGASKIVSVVNCGEVSADDKGEDGDSVNAAVAELRSIICKFPRMQLEKIVAKAKKADVDLPETSMEDVYSEVQVIISMLKEAGKMT